jgi:hypothetical protein
MGKRALVAARITTALKKPSCRFALGSQPNGTPPFTDVSPEPAGALGTAFGNALPETGHNPLEANVTFEITMCTVWHRVFVTSVMTARLSRPLTFESFSADTSHDEAHPSASTDGKWQRNRRVQSSRAQS